MMGKSRAEGSALYSGGGCCGIANHSLSASSGLRPKSDVVEGGFLVRRPSDQVRWTIRAARGNVMRPPDDSCLFVTCNTMKPQRGTINNIRVISRDRRASDAAL